MGASLLRFPLCLADLGSTATPEADVAMVCMAWDGRHGAAAVLSAVDAGAFHTAS